MANHTATKKRYRRDIKVRASNKSQHKKMRTMVKNLRNYFKSKTAEKSVAEQDLVKVQSYVTKCGQKRIVHPCNSSRLIGKLYKQFYSAF